ncbi:MAG: glycosyltransferase family 2 protein [Sphingobium sp.]
MTAVADLSEHEVGIDLIAPMASYLRTSLRPVAVGESWAELEPLQLAVVIPALNEAGNVLALVEALEAALTGLRWEAIFVDDGSVDGTVDLIDDLALHDSGIRAVKRIGRTGLASAVIEGTMNTAAPVVAVIDGDMQHDERILRDMYRVIADDRADMVIGSRYMDGGGADGLSNMRLQGSLAVTRLSNVLLRRRCTDPMSGFFAIRRSSLAALCPRLSAIGFKIALDILMTGGDGLRVIEQPFRFRTRLSGESKISLRILADLATLCVDKTIGRLLPTRLLLFLAVGSLGLLVHLAILRGALRWTGDFRLAQTVAVLIAIAFNFTLNNIVTYASQRLRGWRMLNGLLSFYLVCGTGAFANIGIATLMFGDHRSWWLAGVAGAAVGAV